MTSDRQFDVAIVGAGAAGIATAASLLRRDDTLSVVLVDPADRHFYQPGWTMVGGGVFTASETTRPMASVIPRGCAWIKQPVAGFEPETNRLHLGDGSILHYERLVVSPGLELHWGGIDGLEETLGRNGVTSNYSYETAPYTWNIVQSLKSGKALFTQPPMPIKCAGAPQKAMYLSADHWHRTGSLESVDVHFHTATPGLFGVSAYVPALMKYVDRYGIDLHCQSNLIAVDGERRIATFRNAAGETAESDFDLLHVCPPQRAPGFIRESPLVDDSGWVDVDPLTLQSRKYANVWSLGDVMNAPNAKTAAAARAQAPVVAVNLLHHAGKVSHRAHYNGYGSCPLTVQRGKIVLAEFGYEGKLLPSFPKWFLDGEQPTALAWILKEKILPWVYWEAMLKGREWLVKPIAQV